MILAEVLQPSQCRAGSTGAELPSAAPCRAPVPQQRREQESGHVAAHKAGFSLENKNRSKPPLRRHLVYLCVIY